jgi:purine-binding chemotaxis protein CheW
MKVTLAPAPVQPTGESIAAAEAPADAVVVRLGDGRFAVALDEVAEVGKVPAVTRVPGAPGWVAGVVNWRGRILAVLDLGLLLGADAGVQGAAARLVVLVTDVASVGVLVDGVEGTAALGDEHEAVPAAVSGVGADLVRGLVSREDGPVALLDVGAVIRLRNALPRKRTMNEEGSWTSPSG